MAEAKTAEEREQAKPADGRRKAAKNEEPTAEQPDTPSGLGLQAAEGLEGEEAADAYHKAKKEARWG